MKHEKKEWYTCDRCGDLIKQLPSGKGFLRTIYRTHCKPTELETLTADKYGYITETKLITPEVVSVEIVESYTENINKIHLCGKCRKEFERFMKNE